MNVATCTLKLVLDAVVGVTCRSLASRRGGQEHAMRSVCALIAAMGCAPLLTGSAAAQWYVLGVPEPARVIASYAGPDSVDRKARQVAALHVIRGFLTTLNYDRIARDMAAGRPRVAETAEEHRLDRAFASAEGSFHSPVFDKAATQRAGAGAPEREWDNLVTRYEVEDAQFSDEVLHRFFAPEWVSGYLAARARLDARVAASKREEDSTKAADSLRRALAGRVAPPVPAAQRSFALGLHVFCRHYPGRGENPPSDEVIRRYMLRLDTIARRFPSVTDWSGTVEGVQRDGSGRAVVAIDVDTVSRYTKDEESTIVGLVNAKFAEGTPLDAAVSRVEPGQLVYFSGRLLEPAEDATVNVEVEEVAGCGISFTLELTAIRPVP